MGRLVSLSSGLALKVPGCTVDRQCGSSQQALHFASQAIMSGTQDIVIAGGGEMMSTVPIWCSVGDGMVNGRGAFLCCSFGFGPGLNKECSGRCAAFLRSAVFLPRLIPIGVQVDTAAQKTPYLVFCKSSFPSDLKY